MKKIAIIVAGGSGIRMGADKPKQFLLLADKPLLWHTVKVFLTAYNDMEVIVVLPSDFMEMGKGVLNEFTNRIQFTEGGATRFHSVQNGLKLIQPDSVVFVHDAVRCLVSKELIQRCYELALLKGTAIPAVAATDSLRLVTGDTTSILDREQVRIIQTPQTFLSNILLPAFEQAYDISFTDEATVAEAYGHIVSLVEGEYDNIKITRPADLAVATTILANRAK
jgi:2-C-methyl-D-erythritol 4-phosphate cytidylyltransferase